MSGSEWRILGQRPPTNPFPEGAHPHLQVLNLQESGPLRGPINGGIWPQDSLLAALVTRPGGRL